MALETSLALAQGGNGDKRDVSRVLRMLECATLFTSTDEKLTTHGSYCDASNDLSARHPGRPPASDAEVGRFGAGDPWRGSPMVAPLAGGSPALASGDITPLCDLVVQCSLGDAPATSPLAAATAMQGAPRRRRPQLQLPHAHSHPSMSGLAMWLEDSPCVGSGSEEDATTPLSRQQPVNDPISGITTSPLSAIQKIWAKPLTPHAQRSASVSGRSGGGGSSNGVTPPSSNRWICDLMQATDGGSSGAASPAEAFRMSTNASAAAEARNAVDSTAAPAEALPPAARLARKQAISMDLAHLSLSLAPMHGASPISIAGLSNGTISPCGSGPWSGGDDSEDNENDSDSCDGTDAPTTPVAALSVSAVSATVMEVTAAMDSPRVPRRQRSHAGFDSECPYGGECKQWRLNKCRYWPWHESEGHPLPPPKTPRGTDPGVKNKKKLRKRPSLTPAQRQNSCHTAPSWGTPRSQGGQPNSRGGSVTPRFGTPPQPPFEGVWAVAPMPSPPMPAPVSMNPHGHQQQWVHAVPVQMGAPPHGIDVRSPRFIAVAGPPLQRNPHNPRGVPSPCWGAPPGHPGEQQHGSPGGQFMPVAAPAFVAVPRHPGFHW